MWLRSDNAIVNTAHPRSFLRNIVITVFQAMYYVNNYIDTNIQIRILHVNFLLTLDTSFSSQTEHERQRARNKPQEKNRFRDQI